MPVLVMGAETALGREAVARLLLGGGEVRVYLDAERSGDHDVQAFRDLGCKVALGALDDEAHVETALAQVHTVVHLAIEPLRMPRDQLDALATVTSAALGAHCRRLIWVTELAAQPEGNAYLDALADAASLVADLPLETVTLRCALRYGPEDPLTAALRAGALSATGANPEARHAPLFLVDAAHAVALADRQRGASSDLHVSLELTGPDQVSLGRFVDALGAPALDAARPASAPQLPAWVPDWLSRSATGDDRAVGRYLTNLEEGLARTASAGENPDTQRLLWDPAE